MENIIKIGKYSKHNGHLNSVFWSDEYIELKDNREMLFTGVMSKSEYISILQYKMLGDKKSLSKRDYNDLYEWVKECLEDEW